MGVCGPLTTGGWGVKLSVFPPYKLSRAGNGFPQLEEIPVVAVWHTLPGTDGQHYSDTLSEQGGRDRPGQEV